MYEKTETKFYDNETKFYDNEIKRLIEALRAKGPDELTNKVWSLDQRQLLNTKRWLGVEK